MNSEKAISRLLDNNSERRTFLNFFVKFSAVSMIVIFFSLLIFINLFRGNIFEKERDAALFDLRKRQEMFEYIHRSLIASLFQLKADRDITDILILADPGREVLLRATEKIDNMLIANTVLHSIFAYSSKNNNVYANISLKDKIDDFFGPYFKADIFGPELNNHDRRKSAYSYIPKEIKFYTQSSSGIRVLTLYFGDFPYALDSEKWALVANIDADKLMKILSLRGLQDNYQFYIVNSNGLVLATNNTGFFRQNVSDTAFYRSMVDIDAESGSKVIWIDGQKQLASFIKSENPNILFLSLQPYDFIMKDTLRLQAAVILVFVLLLLAALTASYFNTLSIYKPLNNIRRSLSLVLTEEESGRKSETIDNGKPLKLLEISLDRILDMVSDQNKYLSDFRSVQIKSIIKQLLEGEPINPGKDFSDGIFKHDGTNGLAVIVAAIDDYQFLTVKKDDLSLGSLHQSVLNEINKRIKRPHFTVDMGKGDFAVILRSVSSDENLQSFLNSIIPEIQRNIEKERGTTLSCGCGQRVSDIYSLSLSYQKAVYALNLRFKTGKGSINTYTEDLIETGTEYSFPEDQVKHLIEYLKVGKLEEAYLVVEDFFDSLKEHSYEDFIYSMQVLFYLFRKELLRDSKAKDLMETGNFLFIRYPERIERIENGKKVIKQFCYDYERYVDSAQIERQYELIKNIKDYIQENIEDINLSVDSISDAFCFSAQHLRNLFKKYDSQSISDYILEYRLEEFRKMLIITDTPIKDLAEKSGFNNYNYLFTLFKKTTGITPLQYRREQRQKYRK